MDAPEERFSDLLFEGLDLATVSVGELHGNKGSIRGIACDCLTTCLFLIRPLHDVFGWHNFAIQFLRAAAGWDLNEEDWLDLERRTRFMERCNSIREGHVPTRDDMLPNRFFEETIYNRYGEPKILNREEFLELREKQYLSYELTPQGIPPRALLRKLGMDFVMPVLENRIIAW